MSNLQKETIRFFKEDTDLIREFYPGSYGEPGVNEVVRQIVHSWVDQNLRNLKSDAIGVPDVKPSFANKSTVNR